MASSAVVEVEVNVRVTVKVEAELATEAELRRFVTSNTDAVCGAVADLVPHAPRGREREIGWLDENRSAYATEVTSADVAVNEIVLVR